MTASERIPEEKRAEIKKIVMYIKQNVSVNQKYTDWIIEVYNAYYSPNPIKKSSCNRDVNTVLNQLYACVQIWNKQDTTSQK